MRLCRYSVFYHRKRLLTWTLLLSGVIMVVTMFKLYRELSDIAQMRGDNYSRRKIVNSNGLDIDEKDVMQHLRSNAKQTEYIDKRGMHVVVGKYVGESLSSAPQLTFEETNANNFWPLPKAGEQGQPVFLASHEERKAKRLWHINKFNIVVSDRIPLNRTLPDVRKSTCQMKHYNVPRLPDVSVIIVFHNEAWSTLLRTVHSVINRTPTSILREIILVDDASNRTFLGFPLVDYLDTELEKTSTRLIRSEERVGLIKARLLGAAKALGGALVFLDAHCETTEGWIEPLLQRIQEDPKAVVCPVIDIINDDSFSYVKSFALHWGGFNWELNFRWFTMGQSVLEDFKTDGTKPYRSPVMAGGLFAIDRKYFYHIGAYDEEMDIWGGENLELSFRVWMCGGSVEIAPCSHVGHIFRKASPYSFPREGGVGAVLHANLARVALVWMDEYVDFYFKVNAMAKKYAITQDVGKRKDLRDALKCKNFQWYLDNVWPEHFFPAKGRYFGKLKHQKSGKCLQKPGRHKQLGGEQSNQPSGPAILEECIKGFYSPQQIVITTDNSENEPELDVRGPEGYIMADESICLDSPTVSEVDDESTVRYQACNELDRQIWFYDKSTLNLIHTQSKKCLSHPKAGTSDILNLKTCKGGSTEQMWELIPEQWKDF